MEAGSAVFGASTATVSKMGYTFLLADVGAPAGSAPVPIEAWPPNQIVWWACLAGFFGLLVGMTEILGRYRDEPIRALFRIYGVMYMGFNAAVSAGLFLLLDVRHASTFPTLTPLDGALLSGFGAMALLRSKFFTFRTKSDEEIPIGFDVVVKKLLDAADRGVDRSQSRDRWRATYESLRNVSDVTTFDDLVAFLRTALKSYQNVSPDELDDFDKLMASLRSDTSTNVTFRAMAAGLAFQEIAGTRNFDGTITQFLAWKQAAAAAQTVPQA